MSLLGTSARARGPVSLLTMVGVEQVLRDELMHHAVVRVALLFGSYARGSERPDSDVDVAVLGPDIDRLALAGALSTKIGREVDVVDLADPSVTSWPTCYGSIDTALVHAAGTRGLADLEAFAREVASWAAKGHFTGRAGS